ncbi:MAG: hypothetical protein AAF570_17485 [Bacteroidota bacterium]
MNQKHLDWICDWWKGSYTPDSPYQKYPWTALGYTYDWGTPPEKKGGGQSEFLVLKNSVVIFDQMIYPERAFCGPARRKDTEVQPGKGKRGRKGKVGR